ncbi:hypothetical protein Tco_0836864, partial [Tanacetum coccineum]
MYYPRFTKAIIHHFITKDKSISMRNRMFMHTAEDDNILGPMRFVSKADNYQVYGALLPEVMPNQKMQDSPAYKTYLAFATGATSPKKARKFKKPASPLRKRTLVTIEEEEPEPAKKVVPSKKPSRKYKGIDLLSEAALLEEAQVKKVLKRSRRETTIHQAGSSGNGTGSKPGVPDEPKGQSCSSMNIRVTYKDAEYQQDDEEDALESDDDLQQADDERTDSENQMTNDEDEESEDAFVHTPEDYVPTDDETNDETKDVDEEEYERISEELYGDVNVEQTQEQTTGVQEESGPEMASIQVTTTPATTITSLLSSLFPSLQQSIPIPTPTNTEATTSTISVPESETLSALYQRITNLEKDVKELKNVDNSTTIISTIKSEVPNAVKEYLRSSLDDALYKVIQKYFADVIKEHSIPAEIVERLRQQYVPQKSIEDIREIKMDHARKQQVPKETITSSDTTALEEFDQKTTSFNTMTKSKSFNKSPKHRALYHALMESILEDEDVMDKGVANELKKRKPNDADKDEGPSAGSD